MKILCGGCFNRIHLGHIFFLKQCRNLGKELYVIVSNDRNNPKDNKELAMNRKKNISSLKIADYIYIGNPIDHLKVVEKISPNIIAFGFDQKIPQKILDFCRCKNIQIARIDQYKEIGRASSRERV